MPKVRHSVNLKSKLTSYISEFKEDGLSTDNKILFCNLCQCAVSSTQKFLVQQHITTSKHQANKQLNSKQRQLFLTQPTTSNHTFSCIIKTLKSLQNRHLSLSESFEIINSTVEQLNRGRGKVADAVRAKVDTVLSKNPGYEELQKVVAVMSGESTVKINLDLSPADIVKLNYVPVTSCDVFQYKSILGDNRRRFTFQHLKEMFITYCYGNRQ
ncbi:hypothetical protein C0J52_22252 [Blattella germanica]|nr:hypothetical protein C0J52_22252 [Blattella germanica]